jgi:hypothetical protein
MSFWGLSDGSNAATSKATDFEIGGGNMEPIPDGSNVLAMIDEAKWETKDGAEYISLRWTVAAPDAYRNRKIFQKLFVTDDDPSIGDATKAAKKRDKARRMLAAIDTNAGGILTSKPGKPTADDLGVALGGKPMVIKVMLWEIDDRNTGEKIRGNWVGAVADKSKAVSIGQARPTPQASAPAAQTRVVMTTNDGMDIPF